MKRFTHKAMDTEFTISFGWGETDEVLCGAAACAAFDCIDELELTLTRFNDTSDVAVIRGLKPGQVAVVSPKTTEILSIAAHVCAATKGAFDPTLGRGFNRLVIDVENHRVAAQEGEGPLELDFGGIGKGYALDECRKVLADERFEIRNYLLDAGTSTIWAEGLASDGKSWRLGVGGPWKSKTHLASDVMLSGEALSGSGFELRGEHIVDPRRGGTASNWLQSWSRASSAAVADAFSTAVLSLSAREIREACLALHAGALVARKRTSFLSRFQDPLVAFNFYGKSSIVNS